MMYKNSTLIRSIIATSFLLNTVACGNNGVNGMYDPDDPFKNNEGKRKQFVEKKVKDAEKVLEKLKEEDEIRKNMEETWKNKST